MKPFWMLAIGLVVLVGVWGWIAGWWTPEPLVLGTHADFHPFAAREEDPSRHIAGFNVDLARAIAEKARRPLVVVDLPAEDLIPALEAGTVDLVVAAMAITPERAARVAFSDPYYEATPVALVLEGDTGPAADLEMQGRKIAAHRGTSAARIAEDATGLVNFRETPTAKAAVVHLLNSQVDVALVDAQAVAALQRRFPEAQLAGVPFPGEFHAVAVRKDQPELRDLVNQTLRELAADGRYDALVQRWLVEAN